MAGTTTTLSSSSSPFSTGTNTPELLHSLRPHAPRVKVSFPLHYQTFPRNYRIAIHQHGKVEFRFLLCIYLRLKSFITKPSSYFTIWVFFFPQPNNSTAEETHEIADEGSFFDDGDDMAEDEESDEEEETESSVDLLIRFLQSMVKKITKRAKKASRSVLPPAISTQLVIPYYYYYFGFYLTCDWKKKKKKKKDWTVSFHSVLHVSFKGVIYFILVILFIFLYERNIIVQYYQTFILK